MQQIKFYKLTLHNFKSHRDLEVNFGELTKITGDNAKGKSSILEAIPWTLYGTDTLGGKLDPSPLNYEYDEIRAELLFSVDGKQVLLGRGIRGGKVNYRVNDVPSKAGDFDEIVKSLFDRDLFLSLFNPSYFFTLHWEKQREMLLRYVTTPANKDVFGQLPDMQAAKLAELLKKHSINDLEKIHSENKRTKDKAHIAAQSRTKTLQEQLQMLPEAQDAEALQAEHDRLTAEIKLADAGVEKADKSNKKIIVLQAHIKHLVEERDRMKAQFSELQKPIEERCHTCQQQLNVEARGAAEAERAKRIDQFKAHYDAIVVERKELEAKLVSLEYIDVSEQREIVRELERQLDRVYESIRILKQREQLREQVEKARADEAATLESLRESIFILDAIKDFRAAEADLQATKVQELFTTLSICLFEQQKNGDIKNTFEIEMDGKPYRKLSLSEGIRAGLELRDVLSQQSGIVAPVFVDNAESITSFQSPTGQLITCRVVAGQELKIETEDEL
ncbi:AAA family ATPase [Paenibacillus elgii]|uniref:AAA family ATPase n=1 Tax=Paenibacillus elgii TaxID=189691 RepID=UPI000248E0AA|nr:AAA family ATPase [Paenibacillus elgii]